MKRNATKLGLAVMAGAAGMFVSQQAHASLVITNVLAPGVVFTNGTYDKYTFTLSSMSGNDATAGPAGQNPELLLLEGTFSATGAGAKLLVPGDDNSANNGYWTKYITKGAGVPAGFGSSTVNLPTENESFPPARTSTTGTGATYPGSPSTTNPTGITGIASTLKASWFVAPTNAAHAGGIESTATGSAAQSRVAIIYVTPGGGVSFTGDYGSYAAGGTQLLSFGTTPAVANKIVSLTATSADPNAVSTAAFTGTFNPNTPTVGAVNVVGAGSSFVRGELNGISAGAGSKVGQTQVRFENAAGTAVDPGIEYIGLNVADGANAQGSAQFNTDIQALLADLNGSAFGFGAVDAFATAGTGLQGATAATQLAALGLNAGKSGSAIYDIVIAVPSVGGGASFFALNLGNDAALPAGLTVTDIAAVPEPATAAGLLIGASGLLLGRRKRKA